MSVEPLKVEPLDLDNSRLETYGLCPMKYHNQYNLGLATPKHLNTRFSTHMVHDPITEWYLKGKDWSLSDEEWERRQARLAITAEEQSVKANAIYNADNAKRCFEFYTKRFEEDHDRFEFLGIEQYLVDTSLGFGSKPDVRARERETGKLYTFELKFSDWDFILEAATMNPQFLGQINNTKGHGCIVTLVQPSGAKWGSFGSVRQVIEPTAEELEAWRKDTAFKIQNVRRSYKQNQWPKHTPQACTAYGGCYFVDLCTAGHPKEMLDRFPRAENPLAYLTEGAQDGTGTYLGETPSV